MGIGHKAVRGGGVLLMRHGIAFALNFIGGVFLARLYGPSLMGLYLVAYSIFLVEKQIVDFSITPFIIRQPKDPDSKTVANCFFIQQGIGLLIVAGTIAFVSLGFTRYVSTEHPVEFGWLLLAAAVGAYCYSWQSIPSAFLERTLSYGKVGFMEVADPMVFNVVAVIAGYRSQSLMGLALALALRGAVPAIIAQVIGGVRLRLAFGKQVMREILRQTLPLVGGQSVVWIIMLAPVVVIGGICGSAELGIAQFAYGLLGTVGVLSGVFQRVGLSALSRIQNEPGKVVRMTSLVLQTLAVILISGLLLIVSFSPVWVPWIYGQAWAKMSGVFMLGAIPMMLVALLGILYSAVLAKGHARLIFKQNIIHAIIYWISMILLAKYLGAYALPLAHLLAVPAGWLYLSAFTGEYGPLDLKPLLVSLAGGVAVAGISWGFASAGTILVPIVLWVMFFAVWGPWMWRKANATQVLRMISQGDKGS